MYQPISGPITAHDAAQDRDPLFPARTASALPTDQQTLDWYEQFAEHKGAELDNYLAGWDETCKRRGLPAERRVFFAKV